MSGVSTTCGPDWRASEVFATRGVRLRPTLATAATRREAPALTPPSSRSSRPGRRRSSRRRRTPATRPPDRISRSGFPAASFVAPGRPTSRPSRVIGYRASALGERARPASRADPHRRRRSLARGDSTAGVEFDRTGDRDPMPPRVGKSGTPSKSATVTTRSANSAGRMLLPSAEKSKCPRGAHAPFARGRAVHFDRDGLGEAVPVQLDRERRRNGLDDGPDFSARSQLVNSTTVPSPRNVDRHAITQDSLTSRENGTINGRAIAARRESQARKQYTRRDLHPQPSVPKTGAKMLNNTAISSVFAFRRLRAGLSGTPTNYHVSPRPSTATLAVTELYFGYTRLHWLRQSGPSKWGRIASGRGTDAMVKATSSPESTTQDLGRVDSSSASVTPVRSCVTELDWAEIVASRCSTSTCATTVHTP